ncbi:hypothetical protein CRG98_009967 [Punica granatum]|uniref:Reverse transcriptase RNase H-like domain-containing protein n=1 Tax=Punica granatum TaxID=22663 RepID=A0A2I0KM92_PUNGR|nr:hypothetical protein CRG98_009967 [Punica granatum]
MHGIKKFEFHLVGYKFLVEMDMFSFPKMLQFKQKQLPHPQLLRWAEWFSKFDVEVKHIKGKHNTLADFLSRKEQALTRQTLQVLPVICMFSMLQFTTLRAQNQAAGVHWRSPRRIRGDIPLEVHDLVREKRFQTEARNLLWHYQWRIFRYYGGLTLLPFGMHPQFPYIHSFKYSAIAPYPEDMKWFYWYACHCYTIGIQFKLMWYVGPARRRSTRAQAQVPGEPSEFQRTYSSEVWKILLTDILEDEDEYREFQRIICEKNGVVP